MSGTNEEIDEFHDYDAAYVLGALPEDERRAYERHLTVCPRCAGAVRELAGMPALLSRVPPDEVAVPDEPVEPPTVLPDLLARVRRRRRAWRAGLSSVAAAFVLLIALVLGGTLTGASLTQGQQPRQRPMTALAASPVSATVALTDMPWGTAIGLRCKYTAPTSPEYPEAYSLVVVDRNGGSQELASWQLAAGGSYTMDSGTKLHRERIAAIQVRGPGDTPMLTISP